ncbi:MAG: hypothetical protein WBG50_04350 [Desulfomonilaceae bacterium]
MAAEAFEPLYTLVLTSVKDDESKRKVALTLSRITRNLPVEKAVKRMESLPWTLTRRASAKNAARLVRLMEKLGATLEVSPPLPEAAPIDLAETQVLPGTTLLEETQAAEPDEPDRSSYDVIVHPAVPARSDGEQLSHGPAQGGSGDDGPPSEGGVSIQPLSLGGIIDRTFQICRRHFWKLLAIVGIPYLVVAGLFLIIAIIAAVAGLTWGTLRGIPTWAWITAAVTVIPSVVVVMLAVFFLSQGALIYAVSSVHNGREFRVGDAFRFVLARLGRFILTYFLFVVVTCAALLLAMLLGAALFFISREILHSGWWSVITWPVLAGLWLYVLAKLLLFDKVVIIEHTAYISALERSWRLLTGKAAETWPRGYLSRLTILLILFVLISVAITLIFQVPAAIIAALMPESRIVGTVLQQLLSNIGGLIGGLFGAVSLVVFYYDIRSRKEGVDPKELA